MAWKHVSRVMNDASITGVHAAQKGLRHGFGVCYLVQKLLGQKSLETTAIYMDLVGEEERAEILAAW